MLVLLLLKLHTTAMGN